MIEALRNDDIIEKVGGRFKLTSLIQRRWLELMRGAQPLVETRGRTTMEVVIEEILQDKININYKASGVTTPDTFLK
ncbi:MAG: DNA-directed RNA polymerase subunit omega [Phycisphaerae bacterium]|nr:DNA-directed RNA polymerase subunit omega [Phycisphaerae bacterium]